MGNAGNGGRPNPPTRVCGNIKGATFPKIPGARGLLKSCWHQQKSCSLGPIEGGKIASGVSGAILK